MAISFKQVASEWRGDDHKTRMRRAAGRSLIAIGENIVADAKPLTHVVTGTLRRSLHTAPVGYAGDDAGAATADLPNADLGDVTYEDEGAYIEMGSWLPYANYEFNVRGHDALTPAVEASRGYADDIIARAVREEGL